MQAEYAEYKRWGRVVAAILVLLLALALMLVSWQKPNPPFEPPVLESIELDFTEGGGSSAGAPSKTETPTESESSMNQPEDPVVVHDNPESPVVKTDKPVEASNNTTNNNSQPTETTPDPKNDLSSIFGNGNGSQGDGTGEDGNGQGPGSGPGIGSGTGKMGGSRRAKNKPKVTDNYIETGVVVVKIYIKRDGTVDKSLTKVVPKNLIDGEITTCTSKTNKDAAKRAANKFKYDADPNAKKLEYSFVNIVFDKH